MPLTPPPESVCCQDTPFDSLLDAANPFHQYPAASDPSAASPPCHPIVAQDPGFSITPNRSSSSDEGSVFSDASNEPAIQEDDSGGQMQQYVPSQPINFYGNFIPLDPLPKPLAPQQHAATVRVC